MGNFIIFVILSLFFLRRILGHLFHFLSPHHFFLSFSRTFFSFPFFLFVVAIFSFLFPRLFLVFIGTIIFIFPLLRLLTATTKPTTVSVEASWVEIWVRWSRSVRVGSWRSKVWEMEWSCDLRAEVCEPSRIWMVLSRSGREWVFEKQPSNFWVWTVVREETEQWSSKRRKTTWVWSTDREVVEY